MEFVGQKMLLQADSNNYFQYMRVIAFSFTSAKIIRHQERHFIN